MVSDDYFRVERREMLPFVPAQRAHALEIGCGEGRFIAALSGVEEGWGIEPSQAAAVAERRLTRVLRATFDDAERELPLSHFDVVICNDVIEHLPDYSSFLSRIGKYLAPGGMIVGSIPNVRFYTNMFQYMLEKDWYYTDWGILDRTHLAFFTEKSLRRTLEHHGYKVVQLAGINKDYRPSGSARNWAYFVGARVLAAVTFGYFADIRYPQFAFQATPVTTGGS
jgi:2-polyprenyl-3-methyl-5-hydroxy-6-metoxy-1,4-benzoquinol methylase